MQAAAVKEIGEPLGEMGNDFQSGTPGGPPRTRSLQAGELMPLDVAISVRGYRCDLCRTFAVDGQPTTIQQEAASQVRASLDFVEEHAHVGSDCRQLYEDVFQQLDGYRGWSFPHHLGHGTGLSAHEAPRLNPHWNDVLEVGDLFTVEPGLYHKQLCAGVRIEQNYWLTAKGIIPQRSNRPNPSKHLVPTRVPRLPFENFSAWQKNLAEFFILILCLLTQQADQRVGVAPLHRLTDRFGGAWAQPERLDRGVHAISPFFWKRGFLGKGFLGERGFCDVPACRAHGANFLGVCSTAARPIIALKDLESNRARF